MFLGVGQAHMGYRRIAAGSALWFMVVALNFFLQHLLGITHWANLSGLFSADARLRSHDIVLNPPGTFPAWGTVYYLVLGYWASFPSIKAL